MSSMIKAGLFTNALVAVHAQMKGTVSPKDSHPKLNMQECESDGTCKTAEYSITLDASWRWLHNADGYTNCLGEDNKWGEEYCPDAKSCAKNCAIEGLNSTEYSKVYGVAAASDASSLTLNYVPGSRVYMLDGTGEKYLMFKLLNKEFTFDIDLSTLPCGTNAALYLIEMAADGGGSGAGASYGAGYCDAQCPQGMKFINNEANLEKWGMTMAETPEYDWIEVGPVGKYGACCAEFDILEANNQAIAITSHPCSIEGLQKCEGEEECGNKSKGLPGWCDKDGCGLNPYRMGEPSFYGPGSDFTVDTSKPFTVITQFITDDGTDEGNLVDIKRTYMQDGQVIPNAMVSVLDEAEQGNSLNDDICAATTKKFNVTKKHDKLHKTKKSRTWMDTFKLNGGSAGMGGAIGRGMVMSMSVWDDGLGRMNWLDSEKTLIDEDVSDPGVARGPCAFETGNPKKLQKENPKAYVTFSNLKIGPIGSTADIGDAASSPPAASSASASASASSPAEPEEETAPVEDDSDILEDTDTPKDNIGSLLVSSQGDDVDLVDSDDDDDGEGITGADSDLDEEETVDASDDSEEDEEETASAESTDFQPTAGCEWIMDDNCEDTNDWACGCREANPAGPCTACKGGKSTKKKTALAADFALPAQPMARSPASSSGGALALWAFAAAAMVLAAAAAAVRRGFQGPSDVQLVADDEEAVTTSE